jgi:hypothetical protein
VWSAQAYGLVNRSNKELTLTETGRKILAPTREHEDVEAKLKAILTPAILSKFYSTYNGHSIPEEPHFANLLTSQYQIPPDRVKETIKIITENAEFTAILVHEGSKRLIRYGELAGSQPAHGTPPIDSTVATGAVEAVSGKHDLSKVCFFITPIGDDGTEQRRHSDMMLKHVVNPACRTHNLEVVRAGMIEKSGLITKQIFEYLVRSRLCVTDMSFLNANVFYELGVRHMMKLPAVQLIRKSDRIPFDVSQGRTIVFDPSDVYSITERLQSAERELSEHIKQSLQGAVTEQGSPVDVWLPQLRVALS